jgi:CRISPR type III-A-associated protein Csm2
MPDFNGQANQIEQIVTTTKPEFLKEDADYVKIAENTMKSLLQPDRYRRDELNFGNLTTSKIRNILTMVNEIYNDVVLSKDKTLSPEIINRIRYMKVRLVYEAGRESAVKIFAEKSNIITAIDHIGSSKVNFMRYARYLEALTAYHRFLGGRD